MYRVKQSPVSSDKLPIVVLTQRLLGEDRRQMNDNSAHLGVEKTVASAADRFC